jgi:glycogen(starch) synthase
MVSTMRILHITPEYPPMMNGGMANAVCGIATASASNGIDTGVIFIGDPSPDHNSQLPTSNIFKDEIASNEVKIFLIPWDNAIDESIRIVKLLKPDILHLHSWLLFPVAYAIKKQTCTPMVYTVHAIERAHSNKNPLDYLLQSQTQEAIISLVDRVIVLSQTEKKVLLHHCIQVSNRVRVVGNGTDTHTASQYELSRNSHLVLYVGRFVNSKGIADLLRAITFVVEQDPQVHFVLVGGTLGTSREEMQRRWLSDSFPYRDRITFTGWVPAEELMKWYSKAGILVVPSSYDTFPLVILEGMQHGLAVVASAIGGALDIIKHGQTGLLFTPKDIGSLVNCILLLLKDPNLQHQIGSAAATNIRNNWLWPHMVNKLLTVYKEII